MIAFFKKVDLRSRKNMTDFLLNHFRYHTMNPWNQSTSYANNVKIYELGLTSEHENMLYDLIETSELYEKISDIMSAFSDRHQYLWQTEFNGRSAGYIVLYQGFAQPSAYKSYCRWCYRKNYKTVEETGGNRCGCCGRNERVNYEKPPLEIGVYPGRSTEMSEDFQDWDLDSLRQRVELVQDFDRMCDEILREVVYLLENYEVQEQTIYVTKQIKVLREVS